MELTSSSFADGATIPGEYAFCIPDIDTHAVLSGNRNPHLAWKGAPSGTKSFALICHDPDVPTKPDDVNKDGREVPPDLPRTDFFHWLVVNLPPHINEVAAGSFANGVVARGQQAANGPHDSQQGLNDYTSWFAGDPDMEGEYFGYDGPCPPWNDSIIHHYVFTVYALNVARLEIPKAFRGAELRDAIASHVLEEASIIGTYTMNPRLSE